MTAPPTRFEAAPDPFACDHGASYGDNQRRTCVECGQSFTARPEDYFEWPPPLDGAA